MSGYWRSIRNFNASTRYFILSGFAAGFAFFGIATVLFNLYLLRLDYSAELIGSVNGIGQLAWAATALPASFFGMRYGMRNAQVIGSGIIAASYFLILLVENLPLAAREEARREANAELLNDDATAFGDNEVAELVGDDYDQH